MSLNRIKPKSCSHFLDVGNILSQGACLPFAGARAAAHTASLGGRLFQHDMNKRNKALLCTTTLLNILCFPADSVSFHLKSQLSGYINCLTWDLVEHPYLFCRDFRCRREQLCGRSLYLDSNVSNGIIGTRYHLHCRDMWCVSGFSQLNLILSRYWVRIKVHCRQMATLYSCNTSFIIPDAILYWFCSSTHS